MLQEHTGSPQRRPQIYRWARGPSSDRYVISPLAHAAAALALAMEVEHIDFSTLPPPPPPPSLGLRRESARAVARDGPELLQQQRRRSRSRSKHAGQYPAPPPPPPPPMRGSPSLLKRVGSTDSLPSSSLLHQAQQARQPAAVEDRQSNLAAEVV
jgi:hypothetical protein